jgi:hypothetical protein
MKIPIILIFASTLILSSCTQDKELVPVSSDSGVKIITPSNTSAVGGAVNTGTSDSFSGTIRSPK